MLSAGVRFVQHSVWRDEQGLPVLVETGTIILGILGDAHLCDMKTRFGATYGDLRFPATKFGILCVRIEPRLVPASGGCIWADGGREGRENIHGTPVQYVTFHNPVLGNGPYGILMSDPEPELRDPWCVGQYGIVSRNPVLRRELTVPQGADWSCSIRVLAFDGAFREARIRNWLEALLSFAAARRMWLVGSMGLAALVAALLNSCGVAACTSVRVVATSGASYPTAAVPTPFVGGSLRLRGRVGLDALPGFLHRCRSSWHCHPGNGHRGRWRWQSDFLSAFLSVGGPFLRGWISNPYRTGSRRDPP